MRDATAQEIADLDLLDRHEEKWVLIEDADGVLQDWTDKDGTNWVGDFTREQHVDRGIMSIAFTLYREDVDADGNTVSIAPDMTDPKPVAPGRKVVVLGAVTQQGLDPVPPSRRRLLFTGWIDRHNFRTTATQVQFDARGPGGRLRDTFIKTIREYGDAGGTEPIEDVLQQLLTDNPVNFEGGTAPTIYVPSDPSFGIYTFRQQLQDLWQAVQEVAAEQVGDFRYDWDANDLFRPMYRNIDRDKTTPDFTLDADHYRAVEGFEVSTTGLRNDLRVIFYRDPDDPDDSDLWGYYDVSDPASRAEFNLTRTSVLDASNDPQVTDSAEAKVFGDVVIKDTAYPPEELQIEIPFNWRIQLFDLGRFGPGRLWDANKDLAVTVIRDHFPRDPKQKWSTVLGLRRRPTGSVKRWHVKERKQETRNAVESVGLTTPTPDVPDATQAMAATIGFTDGGRPLVTLEAAENAVGVIGTIAVEATAQNIVTEATTNTNANASAGAGSISVAAASGYTGYWCSISDGSSVAEVFYCDSHSAGTMSLDGTLQNSYTSGAVVRRFVERVADKAMGVRARFGTVTCDGTSPAPSASPEVGNLVEVFAKGVAKNGALGVAVRVSKRRGDVEHIVPTVNVRGTRSGTSVSVQFDVEDPSLACTTGLRYKRRDGTDQTWESTWQTTNWDTTSGTFGTNKTVTRQKTFSDPYMAITWELIGEDENGDEVVLKSADLEFASVQQVDAKYAVIEASDWTPKDNTTTWNVSLNFGDFLLDNNNPSGTSNFFGIPTLPAGSLLTNIQTYFELGAGGSGEVVLKRNSTTLATLTRTSSGGDSAALNETVGGGNYIATLQLVGGGAAVAGVRPTVITYATPSLYQSY